MNWIYVVLVAAALFAAVRIFGALRRAQLHAQRGDWDARQVKDLRNQGGNPFTAYEVDFFFNLPDETAIQTLVSQLVPDGFTVDTRPMGGEGASGYSLHARRSMRVTVEDMQTYSHRFRALAQQLGGHYDGWATDPSRHVPST